MVGGDANGDDGKGECYEASVDMDVTISSYIENYKKSEIASGVLLLSPNCHNFCRSLHLITPTFSTSDCGIC